MKIQRPVADEALLGPSEINLYIRALAKRSQREQLGKVAEGH
jgi:hypothetical protein